VGLYDGIAIAGDRLRQAGSEVEGLHRVHSVVDDVDDRASDCQFPRVNGQVERRPPTGTAGDRRDRPRHRRRHGG
jgi:hypothetical protein